LSTAARIAGRGLRLAGALAFLAPLITRLVIGLTFHQTGHGKLLHLDKTASYFTDLGIPFASANAAFISTLEFVGGLCLILGLGTRIFAFLLSCTMIVALLTAERGHFLEKFPTELTDVTPVALGLPLLWLVLYGPGSLSIDHWIRKKLGIPEQRDNI